MVGTVSGDAKTIAIAWLAIDLFKSLLILGVFLGVAFFASRTIIVSMKAQSTIESINMVLGGPVRGNVYWPREYEDLLEAVRKLNNRK